RQQDRRAGAGGNRPREPRLRHADRAGDPQRRDRRHGRPRRSSRRRPGGEGRAPCRARAGSGPLVVGQASNLLDRKLVRDLWTFPGQALGIVLVLACAAAAASMSFSVQRSLETTREDYYRRQGFAELFVSLPAAPLSLADAVRRVPGVLAVAARVVGYGVIS